MRERTHAIFESCSTRYKGTAGRGVREEKVKESCFVNGQLTAFRYVNGRPPFNGIPSFAVLHAPLGSPLLIVVIRISLSVLYFLVLGS